MALDPVRLDDLNWKGMVEAIRRRIPAASDGKWTLHAPVDPGVTLLELFAWQLEQRLYWMDQTPDAFVRGALKLLGAKPKSSRPAVSVFQVLAEPFQIVPRHTELTLKGSALPIVFSTRAPMMCLPIERVGIRVGEVDHGLYLIHGKIFRLFPHDGSAAEVGITLDLKNSLPTNAAKNWFGLFFHLRTPEAIPSQWSPDAAHGVQPAVTLTWLYRDALGGLSRFIRQNVDDGTGGFRRSGVVRLRIPDDWKPELIPGKAPIEDRHRYEIVVRTDEVAFSFPPRLEALVPNAVLARNARRTKLRCLQKSSDWLPIPGNELELHALEEDIYVKYIPPMERAVLLLIRERADGKWHRWRATDDFYRHGPGDRVFVVDRQKMLIRFGDGLTGRLPVLANAKDNEPDIKIRYVAGGGSAGAVGASPKGSDANWEGPAALSALNLVPSEGGIEAETMDEAGQRAAAQIRRPTRAVTKADYEEIARTTPGVGIKRAHAAIGYHPSLPCTPVMGAVTIFIVPDAPREALDDDFVESAFVATPLPDAGALAAVRARIEAARLITNQVFVRAPRYRAVTIKAVLQGNPTDPGTLQRDIEKRLQTFLDPLVGGIYKDGWSFGEPLRPSVILREAQLAVENAAKVVEVAIGLDSNEPTEACREVRIGAHELVWLQRVTVQLERLAQPTGGLR